MVSESMEQQFSHLLSLEEGWDSYGADKITNEAVSAARKAIEIIKEQDPFIVPTNGGGVVLEWQRGDVIIDIEFGPTGNQECE